MCIHEGQTLPAVRRTEPATLPPQLFSTPSLLQDKLSFPDVVEWRENEQVNCKDGHTTSLQVRTAIWGM